MWHFFPTAIATTQLTAIMISFLDHCNFCQLLVSLCPLLYCPPNFQSIFHSAAKMIFCRNTNMIMLPHLLKSKKQKNKQWLPLHIWHKILRRTTGPQTKYPSPTSPAHQEPFFLPLTKLRLTWLLSALPILLPSPGII